MERCRWEGWNFEPLKEVQCLKEEEEDSNDNDNNQWAVGS